MLRRSVVLAFFAIYLMLSCPYLAAKRYDLDDFRIRAEIQPDGRVTVSEAITYDFDGRFSYAFRTIPLKPGESISEIRLLDARHSLVASSSREPGTYQVRRSGSGVEIRWNFRARNEQRTFHIDYTLSGAVRKHPDTAELWWAFVGSDWSRPFRHIEARIEFVSESSPADVETRAWWRGPRHTRSLNPGDGSIGGVVENHPSRSSWEVRMVFSPRLVPDLAQTSGVAALDRIVAEASGWELELQERIQRETKEREERARMAARLFPWMVALGFLGLGVWFLFYIQYGRAPEINFSPVPGEIPRNHSPVFAEYILYGRVGPRSIASVLVDLASRGNLTIREEKIRKQGWFGSKKKLDYSFVVRPGQPDDDIKAFEKDLLQFCLQQAGHTSEFKMSDLVKTARKNRSTFRKWFRDWVRQVKRRGQELGIYEGWPVGVIVMNLAAGVLLVIAGGIVCAMSGSPAGVPAIIGGGLQAALTATLRRRTPQGQKWYLTWKSLKSFIRSRAKATRSGSFNLENVDRVVVAATALGLNKELDRLPLQEGGQPAVVPWFVAAGGSDSVTPTGLGSMVRSISSSMSSASGVSSGGGPSSGASGGGGGGAG